ncbi:branched-chain amino acid transport system II carrier protein [Metabacillus indicus]|uniref:Branched-chain amino acid transport system carrier protein n=1 Tax=Metabacillus indicus TaxID=246786 RepID=A0A084GZS0_METID|nr:branched-chain amino acid transport system II carrier protein [Metabacillus indicus]KEZ50501.1 branched-chain amino acid transporter [Metabacillus indicus LMG 22858]KEZ52832.1 branched-chain amino acid transporter [Metabacillus indicus]MDX8291599.1 branched-chain amino acid transport system II carrier protein [Metabacillus indicus]
MAKEFSAKQIMFISLMLFSMFFGAGNLIFPAFLGQAAGDNLWPSLAGFILSAVGLPILGVIAVAKAGSFHELNSRVHPVFALIFPFIIYVSIGPGLAIPRAGSLAFEMGAAPFLPAEAAGAPAALFIYTAVFFGLVYWLSMSPSKLVDLFGKLLTPIVLTLILVIFVKSLITPIGESGQASGNYGSSPVFQGFLDGYLTMDALAALAFGIVIATAIRSQGVTNEKALSRYMMFAGMGAGLLLTIIYILLGTMGAASASLGTSENGAQILTNIMTSLFGTSGSVILGLVFTLACFCVSIGLVISCSQFFAGAVPRVPYKVWVLILCLASTAVANLGLTQILTVSVPILGMIYPIAIVLIILALVHSFIQNSPYIYVTTVLFTGLFSLADTVNQTFLSEALTPALSYLPLYGEGIGWLVPALLGAAVGLVLGKRKPSRVPA